MTGLVGALCARGVEWIHAAAARNVNRAEPVVDGDLGRVFRTIAAGTVEVADLLAMPTELRSPVLEAVSLHRAILAVHHHLLADAARREREALALVAGFEGGRDHPDATAGREAA